MGSSKGKPTDPKLREEVKESKSNFVVCGVYGLKHPFNSVSVLPQK